MPYKGKTDPEPAARGRRPVVLFVCMTESVHTARWIRQTASLGFEQHVFPSGGLGLHPELRGVTVHHLLVAPQPHRGIDCVPRRWPFRAGSWRANSRWRYRLIDRELRDPELRAGTLAATIRRLKPDLIHTLETQHSGYLALSARETLKGRFPPWLHTPWGSDLYLFGRLSEHEPRVRRVLSLVDAYQPKSKRDADLALKYGFTGRMMPIIPGNGGFDMVALKTVACRLPPSKRTVIHMKGYQGWAGRALFALRALRNIKKDVAGLRIRVTSAAPETALAVELLRREEGMNIEVVSAVSHEDILGLHAESRVSLGASISDGVPNSALEAMAMGAFPIESVGSCAGEWVEHGRTGLLIDPEDVAGISEAVLRVLEDDALVDSAAEQNRLVIEQRMNDRVISSLARETYREVLGLK